MKEKERILDKNNMTLKVEKIGEKTMEKNVLSKSELSRKISLQEKGITLIALVVTIIILLILAGVTLNMALSDNGLFSKTKEATEKYKQEQSDEEEMVRQIATQMYSEYVGAEVTGYNPTGDSDTCEIGTEISGYTENQTFTRKEMTWRIWDFDGNTLRLIGEPTEQKLYLRGVKGYNNGVWAMDHICKELYSDDENGAIATTLKRSDILKVSTFDFIEFKHGLNDSNWTVDTNDESNNISYGESKTYENIEFNCPDVWYKNDKKWAYTKENKEDMYGKFFEDIGNTDGTNSEEKVIKKEKITLKDNYLATQVDGNLINADYLDLLIGKLEIGAENSCWLGTRICCLHETFAGFRLCFVWEI